MTQNITKKDVEGQMSPVSIAVILGAVVLAGYICKIGADVMIPLVVAVFMWYLINAIARFFGFAARKYGITLGRLKETILAMLVIGAMLFTVYELVHSNIDAVIAEAPKFQESFSRIAHQIATTIGLDHAPTWAEVDGAIGKYIDIGVVIRSFAAMLTAIASKTLLVLFFIAFLMYEQRFFSRKLKYMITDPDAEKRIHGILHTIDVKIQKYIGVKASVSFLDSLLTFGILSAFGVDFAGFWGVMAFFLHFIPYAGSFIAISLPVLITLIQFGDLSTVLMVFASLCISHAFLGHILDPYLMGNNLNLSPIVIITNLAIWGMLWGVPGMFLAIPILAIVTLALSQFETTRPIAILFSKTGVVDQPRKKLLPKLPINLP